jgi:frataxin-like iron-binding protein CyaY
MNIIAKQFHEFEILFSLDTTLYLNATETAKHFNKAPKDWLRNSETKKYIEALSKHLNFLKEKLVIVQQGGKAEEQGTWIHKKLVIHFARWLDVEFAIWCDEQIEEILGKTSKTPNLKEVLLLGSELLEILESKSAISKIRLDSFVKSETGISPLEKFGISFKNSYFLPTELGKLYGISGREANLLLENLGFQKKLEGVWKLTESGKEFGMEFSGNFFQLKWKIETLL